jgi:TonB family protein
LDFNFTSYLNLPPYGAIELKRNYKRFLTRALIAAACIHFILIGTYWLAASLHKKEPQTRAIRITKYNELIPLINEIEREYEAMLAGGRSGGSWSNMANGANISTGEGGGSGTGSREAERTASTEVRRLAREALSKEVSQKGILGMLNVADRNGGGGNGGGGAYTLDDLEKAMSAIASGEVAPGDFYGNGNGSGTGSGNGSGGGGLTDGELNIEEARRSSKQAGIDDIVSGGKKAGREAISKKGELQMESASDGGTAGTGSRNANRSMDAIQKVMLNHVPAIRYCYERELRRNPELKGKITVRVTVSPDGSVKDAEIASSTMNDERVERCILSRVRMWKDFPRIDPNEGDVAFKQVYSFGY